jgi:hypothetical protein
MKFLKYNLVVCDLNILIQKFISMFYEFNN